MGGSGHKKMYIYFTVHWEIHIVQQENLVVHPKKDIFGRYIDVFAWYSTVVHKEIDFFDSLLY